MARKKRPSDMENVKLFDTRKTVEILDSEGSAASGEASETPLPSSLISAMEQIIASAHRSGLDPGLFLRLKPAFAYICNRLQLTELQVLIVGILAEQGESMSWREMGRFLGISRLKMMAYSEEVEALVELGWIEPKEANESRGMYEGFRLCKGVVTALRTNQVFVPENLSGKTTQQLVDRMCERLDVDQFGYGHDFSPALDWTMRLLRCNPQLPLSQAAELIPENYDRFLLMNFVVDYAMWDGSPGEGLDLNRIDTLFPPDYQVGNMRGRLRSGAHILQKQNIIKPKCVNGIADRESFVLTADFREKVLAEYNPNRSHCETAPTTDRLLSSCMEIKPKELFFNHSEQEQIQRLRHLLEEDHLDEVRRRLGEKGMRRGVNCIFYGSPGTGKTETVLQLARISGRDIMRVDIASLKDKWVGESEKNIRRIFHRYRLLCSNMERTPILFFNEADAIFARRMEQVNQSVDQMNNAIQNIILEELENLEGILIATTNLAGNLDAAFERRFLFKVKFDRPGTEVKTRIWKSMLGDSLNQEDAEMLARNYDFSGGQIENVVRKQSIDYVLTGYEGGIADLLRYCNQERILSDRHARIGY